MHALLLIFASRLWIEAMRTWAAAEPPPAPARAPDDVILYLVPSRPNGVDARALADAVALYTRDLMLTVKIVPNEGPPASPAENEHLAAMVRSWRARFAFWCVPSPDGRTIGLHSIDARGSDRQDVIDVTGLEGPDRDRAVALKVRSMLPLPPRVPESATAPATTTPPPPRATERLPEMGAIAAAAAPAVDASVSGPAAAATAVIVEPATETPVTSHLAAALEYCLSTGPAAASPRQSLALSVIADFPRFAAPARSERPERRESVEIFTTVEVSLPMNRSVSLYDLPLRAGGRFMYGVGRVVAGVGLFGTAHLLWASASTGGSDAHTFALAGGGGLEVLARGRLAGRLSWQVRPWAEIIVPRTVFLVDGASGRETGKYAAGLGLGLAYGGW